MDSTSDDSKRELDLGEMMLMDTEASQVALVRKPLDPEHTP
jgi:hypothetical protein